MYYRRNATYLYRQNPDVAQMGIHHLENHTMWWAAKGACDLDYVPAFRGLGTGGLPTKEIYNSPGEWERLQRDWDKILKGQEFLSWLEDVFDEVRREIRPEAPSRIGNVLVCPQLGVGFCRQPSAWTLKYPNQRNHVYEIDVTGTAITLNSEIIGTARRYASEALSQYGGGFSRMSDFKYWKTSSKHMNAAKGVIRDVAHEYWRAEDDPDEGLKETIVEGTARIVRLELVAGGDQHKY